MPEERNALAELAERINPIDPHPLDDDYMKASRIIAELANVGFIKTDDGGILAHHVDACFAVERCRAIAAEGVKDGN